jgi:hypothetical protein
MALLIAGEALDSVVAVATEVPMPMPAGPPKWKDGDLH